MKRKISIALIASILGTNMTPAINVFADEVLQKQMTVQEKTVEEAVVSAAKISKFTLSGYKNFEQYNNEYKIQRDEIKKISNNGGQYQSSSIDKAIDGSMSTHWETNTQNSATFTNEVVVEFKDVQSINRMTYATRQDSAKGKGYPTKFKIYASETENDNYKLVTEGSSSVTGDMMEFKFNTVSAKKVKFVFEEANLGWASASEMWFYKEDKIIDKFSEIFTDSTMSKVSSDFNTVEKIEEFKEEAENHPLYNDFQEDLENALSLIKQGKIEETKATVSKFAPYYTSTKDKYDEMFRISNDKIAIITNNGGCYPGTVLKNAIDDNMNTHWETNKANSASFKNEVILTLKNEEEFNRIVYKARNGNKGFANEFSIYVSSATKGENFQKVSSGSATTTSDLTEIKFDTVKARRVKFVFDKANQDWASIGELRLYKQDTLADEINNIFEDKIMSTLKDEYNSKDKINELAEKLENHPSKESLQYIIDAAKNVLNEDNMEDRVLTLSQRGNNSTEQIRTQTVFSLYSPDVTGYYATPGETLKVYVDCDENGPKPKIMFGQIGNWRNGILRTYTLKPGYNEITVADFDDMSPAAIYFLSDSLPGQQSYATKIRFEGGTKYPVYVHGKTDPDKFVEELRKYLEEVNYSDEEVAKGNGKYNICEVTSENIIISTSAAGALVGIEADLNKGKDISYCMDLWEELYDDFARMSGYEMEDETDPNYRPRGKFNLRVFTHGSYGWGAGGYSGYNGGNTEKRNTGFFSSFTNSSTLTSGGWAVPHEIAHQFDNSTINRSESTNNLYSLMLQDKYLENNRFVTGNLWRNDFTAYHNTKNYPSGDYFLFCGVVYQLYAQFGENVYGEAQKVARERRSELTGLDNKQRLAVCLSLATGYDLLYHFEYYKVEMNDKARELVKGLKQLDKKTYYNNNKTINEEAKAFENADVKPTIKVASSTDTSITLEMNIDEDDDRLLLYEVYKDGEFLGITYDENTFVDKNVKKGINYEYSVIAYDRQLNTSKESDKVVKNLNEPKITVKEEKTTLKLREEFNVSNVVKATDYNGNDITKDVKIVEGEVNTNKVGTYDLVLSVTHENMTTTKEVTVNVLSNYEYLSDLKEKSSKVGWSVLRKDKSVNNTTITLLRNNAQVTYEKGLGAHANSEIVYDVEDLGFEYFESKIGVDQAMAGRPSSVTFEVYADGVKKYESKVFKHNTNEESIKVDIKGAKEVKLVTTTAGDGDSADHSVWADAKFTTSNSKPRLEIPSSVSVKVGESIDLNGAYSANDIEDGDLTKKVKVNGIEDVNFNKTGKYEVTYVVKDSDGNRVEKTREIHVVSMDDFKYLTDFNYKSANQTYGSLKINTSNSGNKLRLTDENNKEVVYEKGLGAHSTSTVIYDLTKLDKEYSRFTSYVGIDRQMYNTVGSVEFKVYVDGNLRYESGLMTSKQAQKFVDVDIAGAKELKLLVTDGNNGNGSDHGDWADAKLVFANENSVDLTEEVNISDKYLKAAIKNKLNLPGNTITVGNMLQLTNLTVHGAESLDGLQYAKNLQSLNIEYNEINDLSPLSKLKKLTDLNANNQVLVEGMTENKNNKVTIDYNIVNRDKEKLSPTSITVKNNSTKKSTAYDVHECVGEDGVISIGTSDLESGVYSVYLVYEDKNDNYSGQVLYMFVK